MRGRRPLLAVKSWVPGKARAYFIVAEHVPYLMAWRFQPLTLELSHVQKAALNFGQSFATAIGNRLRSSTVLIANGKQNHNLLRPEGHPCFTGCTSDRYYRLPFSSVFNYL